MSSTTVALVQRNKGNLQTLSKEEIPKPNVEAHQMLVKVSHVAQNPTDVQSFDRNAFGDGSVFGCDFTGKVESIGEDVTRAAKGDTIAGLIWGGEIKGVGAYSEHTVADQRISFKVPASIGPAAASTVPLAAATAWLALFSKDCLDISRTQNSSTLLVWGGSSSVGLYALQLAALYNIKTVTTCSPRNFDLVRKSGAAHVFDHSDPDVCRKITQVAPNVQYIFDTIGNEKSSEIASQALREAGGTLCTVRPGKANTENVAKRTKVTDVLVWTAFLKEHRYGEFVWPAHKDDHELASELFNELPSWLDSGKVKPNLVSIKKGLGAVEEGFQEYRDGKVSAYKIVYEI